jgi:hypothetical protein
MRKIICDKCGKDVPLLVATDAVRIQLPSFAKTVPGEALDIDLSSRCVARLKRWVTERDPESAP